MNDSSSNNVIDYTTLYYSPIELQSNNPGVDLVQAYTNSLFVGTSSIPNANIQQIQPGNRYFLDTQNTCVDSSGNLRPLTTLVDNVMSSDLANPQKQGLMYSVIASLNRISPASSVMDSSLCKPASVYTNGSNAGLTTSGWVSSTEYNTIDPQAISQSGITVFLTNSTPIPTTSAPTTSAPTTSAPTTSSPTTSSPTTSAPTTSAPTIPYTPWQPPFMQGFCSSDTCLQNKTHDTIVQVYLAGLVALAGYIVYSAITRK